MSINAKPWEGGGAASVPDASETTKGKIRIATSAEATTGTDDLTAMTPLTVKERIDAALVGGVEYKGSYTGQSLVTAQKGDMYISSGNQTLGGISLTNGDHIIFNQNASDPVTGSMFDKIDNTDQVTSVNGQTNIVSLGIGDLNNVTISGGGAGGDLVEYDAVDGRWENVTKSTINVGDFNDDATYQLRDAGLTSIAGLTTSADKMIYTTASDTYAVTDLTSAGRALLDDADAAAQRTTLGVAIGTDVQAHDAQLDDVAGLTPADGAVIIGDGANFVTESGATARASLGLTIGTDVQAYDAQLADVAGLTPADGAFIVGDGVNFVTESLATARTSLGLGTAATSDTGDFLASTAALNDLSDVTISSVSNGQVISYNSTSGEWENSTPASGGATDLDGLSDVTITSASSGQILRNNGSGQFVNVALSIVDDPSPQLGGALDVNGQAITSASNGNVTINPDGTGDISVGADIIPDADATHTIGDEDNRFISLYSDVNGALRFKAKNDEGAQITKGQVVYIKGIAGDGETPTVGLADADDASKMPAFGLAFNTANDQAEIQIVSVGNLYGLNTSTFSVGDTLYVDTTAGGLVNTKPTGETAQLQNIGRVIRSNNGAGVIMVGGAGRSAATPNLDNGKIFLGNASNQAVSTALSSAAVTSFNTQTGALTIGGDDLTADHTAVNYTAANANIDGHFSGIDSALALKAPLASPSLTGTPTAPTATQGDNSTKLATTAYVDTAVSAGGGGVDPTLTVVSNTTYTLSAANAPGVHIWYGASNSSTFTVTMPDIANVLSTAVSVNGDPGPTFEVYIGRGQAGDITVSAADGIDLLGDGSITYSTTQTVDSGQWVKLVGWYVSGSTQRYLMDSAAQPRDAGLTSISGLTTAADKMIYTTASDTYAVTDLTAAGRAILDDADATAQRSTLGLGSAATSDTGDFLASTAGLNNLSDVTITSVSNGQVISYNSTSGEWENSTPSSGGATDLDGLSDVTITSASSGQILRNNGSGQFVNVALSIVDDPTPQLGGDLDVNANEIVSASNNNVVIRPNGTGHVFLGGNTNPAEIRLYCESSDAHYVGFKSAAHADYGTSIVWELPTSDGTANQILETNGSGVLSWVDQAGAGGAPPLTTASPSSTYAITDTSSVYQIYLLTPTADVDVTLPSAASAGSGARYDVKNLADQFTLTLKGQSGDSIDGVGPTVGIILGTKYESLTVVSDGSDWFII